MVRPSTYVDGTRIKWGSLGTVLFGAGILAYFEGAIAVFLALVDVPLSLLAGLANFLGQYVTVRFGVLPALVNGAFLGALEFVESSGAFGFIVAIGIVLATLYSLSVVISSVR